MKFLKNLFKRSKTYFAAIEIVSQYERTTITVVVTVKGGVTDKNIQQLLLEWAGPSAAGAKVSLLDLKRL